MDYRNMNKQIISNHHKLPYNEITTNPWAKTIDLVEVELSS